MKIKTDFVTNSSSTCYVMSAVVAGDLPALSGNYEKLGEFYKDSDHTFLYKHYAHIVLDKQDDIDIHQATASFNYDLQLNNVNDYDANDIEIPKTIFHLKLELFNPYWNSIENIAKEFIENLLFKQLKETVRPTQLMYFTFPSNISGDGWDNGDPQGPSHQFTTKYDLYKSETKMGIFTIMDNTIISEASSIKQPLDLNEILLNNINTKGFSLKGT